MTVRGFISAKNKRKLSMLTCYDASFARLLNDTDVDCLLVGDSLAMVVYGYDTTVHATVEMMARHTEAVRRGAPDKMIVADMPFLSVQQGAAEAVRAAGALVRAGADAVKVEGYRGYEDAIAAVISAGIPVMGHLGLTPQFYHVFGGFKVQGRDEASRRHILEGAHVLQDLGVFSIVLECIPSPLAKAVTKEIRVPTIGIGAGPDTDGQVLVLYDLAAFVSDKPLRFVRRYAELGAELRDAVNRYVDDVQSGAFPSLSESFEE
ncbi:3-methyl-2-oxobutanoate hydroxymethyltransferase [Spirochaetia bacterium 38H-sp]|uniref:3-methyl-2-oxobutanoate hydroxymethyltransferase n=1 Tax=Rarispira pelagica TaxID=3141764 RepID=A0ABU9UC42_9SPIR